MLPMAPDSSMAPEAQVESRWTRWILGINALGMVSVAILWMTGALFVLPLIGVIGAVTVLIWSLVTAFGRRPVPSGTYSRLMIGGAWLGLGGMLVALWFVLPELTREPDEFTLAAGLSWTLGVSILSLAISWVLVFLKGPSIRLRVMRN